VGHAVVGPGLLVQTVGQTRGKGVIEEKGHVASDRSNWTASRTEAGLSANQCATS
jgi:hypothetical protein